MYLKIDKADESGHLELFGVSDLQVESDGHIRVWFGVDSAIDGDDQHRDVNGHIVSAVDEASYNFQGAYETIGDIGVTADSELLVISSPKYPATSQAARSLKDEADYDGEFTFITPEQTA